MRRDAVALGVFLFLATAAAAQPPSFQTDDASATTAPRGIVAADFNRDGWPDLALAGNGRKSVAILLNNGRGQRGFTLARDIVIGGGPFDIAAGDLNRDGAPDLAVANADADAITILLGRGDGSFAAPLNVPAPGNPRGVALADLNHDGAQDVFYTAFYANVWRIAYGDGRGGFLPQQASYATGPNPQGIAAGDFTQDGYPDVAVAEAGGRVSVYRTAGYPNYSRLIYSAPTNGWNVITTGDFNHDGWIDLATAPPRAIASRCFEEAPRDSRTTVAPQRRHPHAGLRPQI